MSFKAVLYDHDGTLVDSEPSHFQMWRQILAEYDADLSEIKYKQYCAGMPTPANASSLKKRFSLEPTEAQLVEKKNSLTLEFLSRSAFPLMPGALQSIEYSHRLGLKIGVVTGAGHEALEASMQSYELHRYVSILVNGTEVGKSKPAPDCYLLALQRLKLQAGDCIAIEDTEHGIKSASAAGIFCLGVPNEMSINHDFSLAKKTFDSITQATDWIIKNHT